jgi:hypothetical protein
VLAVVVLIAIRLIYDFLRDDLLYDVCFLIHVNSRVGADRRDTHPQE